MQEPIHTLTIIRELCWIKAKVVSLVAAATKERLQLACVVSRKPKAGEGPVLLQFHRRAAIPR